MAHDGHVHDHHHHAPIGHNGHGASQWQTPHLPDGAAPAHDHHHDEPDLDLVETAFLDAFPRAADPTSFLRLAGIPFVGVAADGKTLKLLRVEANQTTDIGSLTPHLGGEGFRYDPLPAAMTSRRETLAFAYHDGTAVVRLTLAEVRALKAEPAPP